MKFLLVAINLLLAIWLLAAVGGRFAGKGTQSEEFSVKKRDPAKKTTTPAATSRQTQPESIDSLLATIVDNNIFNPDRCPNAQFGRGRSTRVELTLVGTFAIGESKGAIILQKTSSNNRFQGGMMGGMGMMGGAGGQFGGAQAQGQTQGQGASRSRFGTNRGGATGTDNSSATSQAITVKQYVRVGEALSNGYTLAEVTRTGAVLTRGSDKMELELQDPSKNQTAATPTSNQRTNPFQQMQQMQQMQMMQNFQMMRMMRDTMSRNQNQNQNQGGGNRGGNTGGMGGGMGGPGGGR